MHVIKNPEKPAVGEDVQPERAVSTNKSTERNQDNEASSLLIASEARTDAYTNSCLNKGKSRARADAVFFVFH